jgi:hypothetical protein
MKENIDPKKAAAYLREHGWVRGCMKDDLGGRACCTVGAVLITHRLLNPSETKSEGRWELRDRVVSKLNYLHKKVHDSPRLKNMHITAWNDLECKDTEEAAQFLESLEPFTIEVE